MEAWLIRNPGREGVLERTERPAPVCGPEEVRVAVRAIGLNRADLLQRRGLYPAPPWAPADIPGLEYSGEVTAAGERVQRVAVGDRVMGLVAGGAYATELAVHEQDTLPVPGNLDWNAAAAFPEAYLTAYRALFLEGGVQPGQWALVRAATSSVGMAALQLLRLFGAFSLGSSRRRERLEALGPDGPDVPIVDGERPLPDVVREASGDGAHVVLDMLGGEALAEGLSALRDEGTLVLIGLLGGRKVELDTARLLFRRLCIRAMTMRTLPLERRLTLMAQARERLLPHLTRARLTPRVDRVFDFAEANEALDAMADDRHLGKLVLQLA